MKNRKVALLILIVLLLIIIISGSYAFYGARINKNGNSAVDVETKRLSIHFQDGPAINLNGILPGQKIIKTFSVVNNGSDAQTYFLDFIDVINELSRKSDLVYTLTSTNGGATKGETEFVSLPRSFASNIIIPANTTQEYTMTIEYKNLDENQSVDMNCRIYATIQISDIEKLAISDDLPYIPNDPDYTLAAADSEGLKTAIDGFNAANSVDPIDWNTVQFAVFKSADGWWWDYSTYIDCLTYRIYIYPSNTLTSVWSNGTDFSNFQIENPNKYINIQGDGQIVEYDLSSRTIGALYNNWYVTRWIPSTTHYRQYFGDKTLMHVQNVVFDYYYYENYPIWVSGDLMTTDSNNVTYTFVSASN